MDKKMQREKRRIDKKRAELFVDSGPVPSPFSEIGYDEHGNLVGKPIAVEEARLTKAGIHPKEDGSYDFPLRFRLRYWWIAKRLGHRRMMVQAGLRAEVLDERGNRVTVVPVPDDVTYYYTRTGRLKRRE